MFSIMGAGGHKGTVDTLAVHLHVARKYLPSSSVASGPLSVNGMTSCHHGSLPPLGVSCGCLPHGVRPGFC